MGRLVRRIGAAALAYALFLGPAGPASAGDPSSWRQKFQKADADDLFAAITQAAQSGERDAALPLLEAGIAARWPHIAVACGEAMSALGGWPGDDKAAKDALQKAIEKALRAKGEDTARNLARVLGAWGHPLADAPLAQLAGGRQSDDVQVDALFLCGLLQPKDGYEFAETREAIGRALESKSADVRVAACSAAGHRKIAALAPALVSIVRTDREEYPGLYAVWALRQIGWHGGISTFVHVLDHNPDRRTKQACLKGVTELAGREDVEDLLSLTKSSKQDLRDAAALALGRLAWGGAFAAPAVTGSDPAPAAARVPPAVIDRLLEMVETDSSWEVRDAARQGLIRIGSEAAEKVRKAMPGVVDFGDEDARQTAIELCGLFGAKDAARSLYKVSLYDDRSPPARMFAARALENTDPEAAIRDYFQAIRSAKKGSKEALRAVRALGYIRHEAAYAGLVGMIDPSKQEYDESMLREAEYALERLTGHRFGRKPERWAKWRESAKNPFHPRIGHFDRSKNRRDAAKGGLYGLKQDTEKAVEDGLRFLELHQHGIGIWDGNEKGFGGVVGCEPAYTGLALLAFLGAGYDERAGREHPQVTGAAKEGAAPPPLVLGKYREVIRRASEFLAATQFYDGGFPVTGGGDDSWIYAYLIAMGVWGINETYALSGIDRYKGPAQWGIDYLARVQTPGGGWRYGPRYVQSDTSCTSWVLMTVKTADLAGLHVPQRCFDGIDSWLERCSYDITGEEEIPDDLSTDYDYEVGSRRFFKAFTGYLELSGSEKSALQMTSMTAVGMVCRFFMGWKRSHPFLIGSANYLTDYLPQWMKGLEKGQAVAWYHYYWYYGTLGMHQMGGRRWARWNEKIRTLYLNNRRSSPPDLAGSWDPDTAVLNGGRLFSTSMSILTLETYYRFSPLLGDVEEEKPVQPDPPK